MIDTHTHLYLPEFDNDRDATMQRAIEAGVAMMIFPNVDLVDDRTDESPAQSLSGIHGHGHGAAPHRNRRRLEGSAATDRR